MKLPTKLSWGTSLLLMLMLMLAACGQAAQGQAAQGAGPSTPAKPLSASERKDRAKTAYAMWQERCKKSGVFIHKTADNVEGVLLMKLRPQGINYGDQYRMDDPYGRDLRGDGYIESFLKGSFEHNVKIDRPQPADAPPLPKGYDWVETIDAKDGVRYRYTGSVKATRKKDISARDVQLNLQRNPGYDLNIYDYVLDRLPSKNLLPRYGVTYDDISTREERDYWIAGSSLKVIDLQTNETMAERIGYMVDLGQGSDSGGRSAWLFAADNACPTFGGAGSSSQRDQSVRFINQSLKPKR